jgi:hypothetical protein
LLETLFCAFDDIAKRCKVRDTALEDKIVLSGHRFLTWTIHARTRFSKLSPLEMHTWLLLDCPSRNLDMP